MFHRAELKRQAKDVMQGNWIHILMAVALLDIVFTSLDVVSTSSEYINVGDFLMLLLEGPLMISFCMFILYLLHHKTVQIQQFFDGFSNFIKWMLAGLWQNLWLMLWTMLFIIPGIVKYFSYSQYYFILADNPDADLRQALKTSMKMTNGYKGDLFVAHLSFLNWFLPILAVYVAIAMYFYPNDPDWLLCTVLTMPVYLYVAPYMTTTFAGIYEELKATALANGTCSPEEFGLEEVPDTASFVHVAEPQDDKRISDDDIYYEDDEPVKDTLTYMEQKELEQSAMEQKQEE